MRKLLFLILSCCLALTAAANKYYRVVGGLVYYIDDEWNTAAVAAARYYLEDKTYDVKEGDELVPVTYAGEIKIPAQITYRVDPADATTEMTADVEEIHASAFAGNRDITSVSIGKNVTRIGHDAFASCYNLTKATFASLAHLCSIDFLSNSSANPLTLAHHLYFSDSEEEVKTLDFTDTGITEIKPRAFSECWYLTSITIPATIETIGADAFLFSSGTQNGRQFPKTTFASIGSLCKINFGTMMSNPIYYQHDIYTAEQADAFTTVVIPAEGLKDGVLGANIFAGANRIVSVSIPAGTESIGSDAFNGCTSLQVANFPSLDAVRTITYGNEFANPLRYAVNLSVGGVNITELEFTADVPANAFTGTKWLRKVTFHDGVTSIGKDAFKNCTALTTAVFDEGSLSMIEEGAFHSCSALSSVTLPSTLLGLGKEAFRNCRALSSIKIPAGCTNLGVGVFNYCSQMKTVVIEAEIAEIPELFFAECPNLADVTLPATVTAVGVNSFLNCRALTALPALDNLITIKANAFNGCQGLTNLVLPDKVEIIGEKAFQGCTGIASVTLPASLDNISLDAFSGCEALRQVFSMKPTVVSAASSSFGDMAPVITLYVPTEEALTAYGSVVPWSSFRDIAVITNAKLMFYVNDVLQESWTIGKQPGAAIEDADLPDVSTILSENDTFLGWYEEIPRTMPNRSINFYGYYSTKADIGGIVYELYPSGLDQVLRAEVTGITDEEAQKPDVEVPKEVTFHENTYPVTVISTRAFEGCSKIQNVTLSPNITTIESRAFMGCTSLSRVMNIPEITAVSDSLFFGCTSLTQLHAAGQAESSNGLPATITSIGREAFKNCSSLNLPEFPASLTSLGYQAFNGSGIESVHFMASITNLEKEVFKDCRSLKKVTFEDGFNLPLSDLLFWSCVSLEEVTLSPAISMINQGAFKGCSRIADLTIPASVGYIGNEVFAGCTGLAQITVEKPEPAFAAASAFGDATYEQTIVYVPEGKLEPYQAADTWEKFKKLTESVAHQLKYVVDGVVDETRTKSVKAGALVEYASAPEKEGREFSGWRGEPKVMPAEDVEVTGSFKYVVTYYKDYASEDTKKHEDAFFYGDKIEIPVDALNDVDHKFTIGFQLVVDGTEVTIVKQDNVVSAEIVMPANDVNAFVNYDQSEAETDFINGLKYRIVDMNIEANRHAELISGQAAEGEVTIPETVDYGGVTYPVTVIRDAAFKNNLKVTRVTIPASIKEMGTEVFTWCTRLQGFDFKAAVTTLPALTFQSCYSLKDADLPEGITAIGDGAFSGCPDLKVVRLPVSLTIIGARAFYGSLGENATLTLNGTAALPTAQEGTFDEKTFDYTILKTSNEKVATTAVWQNFKNTEANVDDSGFTPCATPVIAYNAGKLTFTCATADATIVYDIAVADQQKGEGPALNLKRTYVVKAYAQKVGMKRSDIATYEFQWASVRKGDVNDDGLVNIADTVSLVDVIMSQAAAEVPKPEDADTKAQEEPVEP